jgi:glycosyltransferase involved in cell wall biosynthesis
MRITHVIPGLTYERGGPPTVLQALVRHQAEAGHEVTVLTTDQGVRHGERPVELDSRVRLERSAVWGPDRLAYAPGFASRVRHCLRASDVLHVHSLFTYPAHAALVAAGRVGVPAVLRPCGVLHRLRLKRSRWRKRAYLAAWGRPVRRACTAWHFTSADESEQSWPWDRSPRFVLPNGLEAAEFAVDRDQARRAVAQRWPRLGDAPYVLFLGRLHPQKRPDLLVEAFLAGAPQSYKLALAGPDECGLWSGMAEQYLRGESAQERVRALGTVTGPEKVALLAGARLLALPSEHENFGVVVLEALGAGTPVLASPHVDAAIPAAAAGLAETVPLDCAVWRDHLARALVDDQVAATFVKAARGWVRETYSWSRIAVELVRRYRWAGAGCPRADLD